MPEGRESTPGSSIRELRFVEAAPSALTAGDVVLDLRPEARAQATGSELVSIQHSHAQKWRSAFVDWLGSLNRQHASLMWWAYTSTAKNMLSSPLGDECFGALALDRFLARTDARRVFVVGARPAQRAALRARLASGPGRWRVKGGSPGIPAVEPLIRMVWQFARLFGLWCAGRLRERVRAAPQAVLFTYVDAAFRDGPDAFFGSLAQRLAEREPPVSAVHLAFVHSGYSETLPKLAAARADRYAALFSSLHVSDLLWGCAASLLAWWRAGRYHAPPLEDLPGSALLRAALRWDLGKGGYFYNLLVYRAGRRLLARWRPRWLLYPYENKALEKLLLLAAREACPECRIVGYQHTSITRRHATLLFAEGEAAKTPLPDRIVTVGEVTRGFLEAHGRYPGGIFATGCALRQQRGPVLQRRVPGNGEVRVLLALSSSGRELVEAVEACRQAFQGDAAFRFGIRPHPEFPLRLLPSQLRDWVGTHAKDLSGSALASNLEWCDSVAYVSSTVALEALGRGRPVVNVKISDPLDPDPVLDAIRFRWTAATPAALAAALHQIESLEANEFEQRRGEALAYVERYLAPPTAAAIDTFLPA